MDTENLYKPYIDTAYRDFSMKLTKNIDRPYIGVRLPILRKLAKEIGDIDFPVVYHEDVLLRGFIIAKKKIPIEEKLHLLDTQLDLLSTWDETDTLASSLKFGKKEIDKAYEYFCALLSDERIYVRRIAVVWIMSNRNKLSVPLK